MGVISHFDANMDAGACESAEPHSVSGGGPDRRCCPHATLGTARGTSESETLRGVGVGVSQSELEDFWVVVDTFIFIHHPPYPRPHPPCDSQMEVVFRMCDPGQEKDIQG